MATPETQFSIYKIDFDLVEEKFHFDIARTDKKYNDAVIKALMNYIAAALKNKSAK